ncbi:glycosyltransferase family 4 protein [Roseateles sp. BYS87W]|uniref:Glycosyltransferase family 4 protein n=1 Tax=Pelomonas baiyunensis TaxID=3299026 RepID=A0ABW7H3A0_9BURK
MAAHPAGLTAQAQPSSAACAPTRVRVLVLTPYFLPAEQGGGSVTAVLQVLQQLRDDFEFTVLARNHDLGQTQAFLPQACRDAEAATGTRIHHLPSGWRGLVALARELREPWDVVYANSVMAPDLALWPLLLRRLGLATRRAAWLLAPRGELMPGALAQRARLKRSYLGFMQVLGLWRGLTWQATSNEEAQALRTRFGCTSIAEVADLPNAPADMPDGMTRAPGPLRVLFVSRIDPVKNLAGVLEVLAGVLHPVELSIVGPIGDAAYWARCQSHITQLPPQVRVVYRGPVPPQAVAHQFKQADLLFLPSLGENHGYVIAEALAAGCPVLISDRTPWRDLTSQGVGHDLALDDLPAFREALARHAAMSDEAWQAQRRRCHAWVRARLADAKPANDLRALLRQLAQPNERMDSNSSVHGGGT